CGCGTSISLLSRRVTAPLCSPANAGDVSLIDGLETLLLERSPDLLVVLDGELKVVNASAGLRSAVPLVAPGEDFLRSLDDKSQARFRQAMTIDRDVTSALSLELVHRGKERLITTAYRFFGLERSEERRVGKGLRCRGGA